MLALVKLYSRQSPFACLGVRILNGFTSYVILLMLSTKLPSWQNAWTGVHTNLPCFEVIIVLRKQNAAGSHPDADCYHRLLSSLYINVSSFSVLATSCLLLDCS